MSETPRFSKHAMASTFVEITRDEFDSWMDSLRRRWKRKPGTEGIYVIPLSDNVGIQIRSSIGHKQMALDKGRASVTIKMVSLKNGKTLGKRGVVGQTKFYRTKDWRRRWAKAVQMVEKAYRADQDYYETTAVMDPEVYKVDTLKTIETVPNWKQHKMLRKWHDVVSRGGLLSLKQRNWLGDLASGKAKLRYANQIAKTSNPLLKATLKVARANPEFRRELLAELKQAKFPPKAIDFNRLPNSNGFWDWDVNEASDATGIRPPRHAKTVADVIMWLNMAGMRWEDMT